MFSIIIVFTYIFLANAVENPVIGILSQEPLILNNAFPGTDSFIAASYVKFLESSGARIVPVWIGQNREYYEGIVNYTNGVLFPGGGALFFMKGGYVNAATQIYEIAQEANKKGVYFPLLGICLGMESLVLSDLGGIDIRVLCPLAKNVPLPLNISTDYGNSKLFENPTPNVITALQSRNSTFHYHQFCLIEDIFESYSLNQNWSILATSKDKNNLEFISIMENKNFPFYGLQFHPEKTVFEFVETLNIPRGIAEAEISQYFSNFFVNECRKNNNRFPNANLENRALIYNFSPNFSAFSTIFEQLYLFDKKDIEKYSLQ